MTPTRQRILIGTVLLLAAATGAGLASWHTRAPDQVQAEPALANLMARSPGERGTVTLGKGKWSIDCAKCDGPLSGPLSDADIVSAADAAELAARDVMHGMDASLIDTGLLIYSEPLAAPLVVVVVDEFPLFGRDEGTISGGFNGLTWSTTSGGYGGLVVVRPAGEPTPEPVSEVPEPATWLTMILGFAAIGAAIRRQRREHAYV